MPIFYRFSPNKALSGEIIKEYMSKHQYDPDALELWHYFRDVLEWADTYFPKSRNVKKSVEWNVLYEENKDRTDLNAADLEARVSNYMKDGEIKKKSGIYEYVLNGNEKALDLRTFDEKTKIEAYERQGHHCPLCVAEGDFTEYDFADMEGDHLVAWSKGGRTSPENCQMLCRKHNRKKGNK